jgi:copper chaperone
MDTALVNVDGMTCANCSKHIKDELSKVNGITQVDLLVDKGQVALSFDKAKVSEDDIAAKIHGASGEWHHYKVTKIKVFPKQ